MDTGEAMYYANDLDDNTSRVKMPTACTSNENTFCIGPDTRLSLWYGRRANLDVDRGPCKYCSLFTLAPKIRETTLERHHISDWCTSLTRGKSLIQQLFSQLEQRKKSHT